MTYERDAWDEVGDQGNGILGQHLKCAKGKWLLDDSEIEVGEGGARICVIMKSATVGEILWSDGKIADRRIGRVADGFVPPRNVTPRCREACADIAIAGPITKGRYCRLDQGRRHN